MSFYLPSTFYSEPSKTNLIKEPTVLVTVFIPFEMDFIDKPVCMGLLLSLSMKALSFLNIWRMNDHLAGPSRSPSVFWSALSVGDVPDPDRRDGLRTFGMLLEEGFRFVIVGVSRRRARVKCVASGTCFGQVGKLWRWESVRTCLFGGEKKKENVHLLLSDPGISNVL